MEADAWSSRYLERINAQGVREVTHKDNMPATAPAAPALNPGRVMPEDVPAKW